MAKWKVTYREVRYVTETFEADTDDLDAAREFYLDEGCDTEVVREEIGDVDGYEFEPA